MMSDWAAHGSADPEVPIFKLHLCCRIFYYHQVGENFSYIDTLTSIVTGQVKHRQDGMVYQEIEK